MIAFDKFNDIYSQHVDNVFRVALYAVSRREVAEEITREAFLGLLQSSETVTLDQIPSWLVTFTHRRAADYWLRWYQQQTWADASEPEQVPAPKHQLEISFEDLIASCSILKPVHRACLTLRFVHRMTRHEIASHTGLTQAEVKGHLHYGLRLFHNILIAPQADFSAQESPADA